MVTDQVTGLRWQGCTAGQVGDEVDCVGTEILYPQEDSSESAGIYCDSLDWGGFTDWRLPHIKELASLMNTRAKSGPTINQAVFPATPAIWFWTSTPYISYPDHSWFLDFGDGHINIADHAYGHAVRCVR